MKPIIEKAKKVRLLLLDIDGVLTDGSLIYGKEGVEQKMFHVSDGQGMLFLMRSGVDIGVITAGSVSEIISARMKSLGIQHVYQGNLDKLPAYEDVKTKLQLQDDQIAYVGDDLPDLPVLRRVGLPITVSNAHQTMHQHVSWITRAHGGNGAVREVCNLIMEAQGTYQSIVNEFLNR